MAPTRPQKLTQTDKLRAMNNLQSEITRRARSLRAEYARAAQSLRSKLEMRIYRIPKALRGANMGDLLQKYIDMQEQGEAQAVKWTESEEHTKLALSKLAPTQAMKAVATGGTAKDPNARVAETKQSKSVQNTKQRGKKRASDIMIAADSNGTDKENDANVEGPRKRAKENTYPASSRSVRDPAAILSPKSNNSRTLPQSPVRPPLGMTNKSYNSRPVSPLKPSTITRIPPSPVRQPTRPATAASMAGTARAAGGRATKATAASTRATAGTRTTATKASARSASNSTNDSSATTGTTIIRRTGATSRAAGNATAAASSKKTTATASTASSARRTAAGKAKAEARPETAMGTRRVLRKRA